MQRISARDAKNGFGKLIDLARAEPIAIEKYGRSVVIVMAVEEYERLSRKNEKHRTRSAPIMTKAVKA
ncbi:MAG: type II toxin-antitoxin system Phd/YefM family antitoxin [Alphaproteobacteria bacterium]|jgi:prevent-host-death family protein